MANPMCASLIDPEARTVRLQLMVAEIIFHGADDLHNAMPALIEADIEPKYLDGWLDPLDLDTTWMLAWTHTTLSDSEFLDLVADLVKPYGGFVWEAGLTTPGELAAWPEGE